MYLTPYALFLMIAFGLLCLAAPAPAKYPDDLPEAEKALAGTVDPWGLPFSDSLRRFGERFAARPEALFALGLTHSLVKVWPNKYWFRGQSVPSALDWMETVRSYRRNLSDLFTD